MQTKPTLPPVVCGFTWAGLMFAVAFVFLGLKQLGTQFMGSQSSPVIRGDQWLAIGILIAISFVAGFTTAWVRRRRAVIA